METSDESEPDDNSDIKANREHDLYYGKKKFIPIIPDRERRGDGISTKAIQGRYKLWKADRRIPSLAGRTMEEVRQEASRIKLGSIFPTFEEFDRCLDSFCVLQGRGAARYSTKRTHVVRVCRFKKTVRIHNRKSGFENAEKQSLCSGDQQPVAVAQCSQYHDQDDWRGPTHGTIGKENSQVSLNIVGSNNPTVNRTPLSTLCANVRPNIHHAQQMQESQLDLNMASGNKARSVVKNTKAWLPPPLTKKSGKMMGPTGACGELSRHLHYDGPHGHHSEGTKFCPFRVRAQRHSASGDIEITQLNLRHSCPQHKHKWRGPTHKAFWLGETLAPRVVRNVKVPVKEMQAGFRMDYKKSTNYHQMWRAVDHVRDWYMGGQRNSFHLIPALLKRIKEVDEDAVVNYGTLGPAKTFHSVFVCPSATRTALRYCVPVVSLDACHTKNKKFPTQLFLACAPDGNGKVVILCWGLAPVENKANWRFFLEHMKFSIEFIDNPHVPFISDRQKDLLPTVKEVFPGMVHGHCAKHLKDNVKTLYGKGAADYFQSLVYADTKKEFEERLNCMSRTLKSGKAVVEYIRKIDPTLYSRYAFPLPRMGQVTSNPCEQTNSGLLPIRDCAPFKILVEMWLYQQKKFVERAEEARKWSSFYTPKAHRRLQENQRTFGQWQVYHDGAMQARVQLPDSSDMHLVTMDDDATFTCTCRELQDMCWPCEHIMAWDDQLGRHYTHHFRGWWKTGHLQALYGHVVPCFLDNDLEFSDRCTPPEVAVRKGRHRVVRIRSGTGKQLKDLADDEFFDPAGYIAVKYPIEDDPANLIQMPRGTTNQKKNKTKDSNKKATAGAQVRCSCCGGLGHNKRTCKARMGEAMPGQAEAVRISEEVNNDYVPEVAPDSPHQFFHAEEVYDTDVSEEEYGVSPDTNCEDTRFQGDMPEEED